MNAEAIVAAEIKKEYSLNNPNWDSLIYTLIAESSINPAYQMEQKVTNEQNEDIKGNIAWLNDIEETKQQLFRDLNMHQKINRITFTFKNRELIEVTKAWDQSVQDEFDANLPKSKRGKINPWYLPLDAQAILDNPSKKMLEKHLSKIATVEPTVTLQDVQNKSFEELISLYRIYLEDKNNPLWDGGVIAITRESDGKYSCTIIQQYAETEEDLINGYSISEEKTLDNIPGSMLTIYKAIERLTHQQYPSVHWNTIAVSVYKDGFVEANFQLNNEDVEIG